MKSSFAFFCFLIASHNFSFAQLHSSSWEQIQRTKKGTVDVYWLDNRPFGFKDEKGQLRGMEIDVIEGFKDFLKTQYAIELSYRWHPVSSFEEVMNLLKHNPPPGAFGVAGFSITKERKEFLKFSPPYLADITVLVSTDDIPIIKNQSDLSTHLKGATAITAPGTTLEKDILQLFSDSNLPPTIIYRSNSYEFLKLIKTRRKSFGYLNLPVYLMDLNKGLSNLRRHNYLTIVNEGRAVALGKTSDWDVPLNAYFESRAYLDNIGFIIGSYINLDLYRFIENFSPDNEISLLNKEKEIQQAEIKLQEAELTRKSQRQKFLQITIVLGSILLLVIGYLFRNQSRNNRILLRQKAEIENQSAQIKDINASLENMVLKRTDELVRKNKALEDYAFITAHKLRSPLASILGLVELIQRMELREEDRILISHLTVTAKNLDAIIHSIIEAIEPEEES